MGSEGSEGEGGHPLSQHTATLIDITMALRAALPAPLRQYYNLVSRLPCWFDRTEKPELEKSDAKNNRLDSKRRDGSLLRLPRAPLLH